MYIIARTYMAINNIHTGIKTVHTFIWIVPFFSSIATTKQNTKRATAEENHHNNDNKDNNQNCVISCTVII